MYEPNINAFLGSQINEKKSSFIWIEFVKNKCNVHVGTVAVKRNKNWIELP